MSQLAGMFRKSIWSENEVRKEWLEMTSFNGTKLRSLVLHIMDRAEIEVTIMAVSCPCWLEQARQEVERVSTVTTDEQRMEKRTGDG